MGKDSFSLDNLKDNFNLDKLKAGLRKYGRTGLFVYLGVSSCVTTGCYIAIKNHVDVKSILGLKDDEDEEKQPSHLENLIFGSGSHIALAILCSKAFIPVKLPVAMALTPYVHRLKDRMLSRVNWK